MRHDFVTLPRHEIVAIGVRVSSRTQGAPKPRPLLRAHDLPWNEGSSDRHERISDHLGVFRAAFCAVPTALCTALKHPAIGPTSPHQAPPGPAPWRRGGGGGARTPTHPTPPTHPPATNTHLRHLRLVWCLCGMAVSFLFICQGIPEHVSKIDTYGNAGASLYIFVNTHHRFLRSCKSPTQAGSSLLASSGAVLPAQRNFQLSITSFTGPVLKLVTCW
jgi:hypothetical protein